MRAVSGLFLLSVVILAAYTTVIQSKNQGVAILSGIWVRFPNVEGLKFGNPVFVQGLPMGDVATIRIAKDKVLVKIILQRDLQFYRDYKIVLKNFSVFGKKAIYIDPGKEKFGPVPLQGELEGIAIENPFDAAAELIQENQKEFHELLANVAMITAKMNESPGSISLLLNDPSIYDGTIQALRKAQYLLTKGRDMLNQIRREAVTKSIRDVIYEFDD